MHISLYRFLITIGISVLSISQVNAAEYSGMLGWANRADLSLPVSGVISEVRVKAGDHAKQGDVLVVLDKRYFESRLNAAKATLAQHKPGRDEAKRELDRALELFERTVLSQVELDRAKNDYAEKEALYRNALASYQQSKLDLEYSELKAPYDLVVIEAKVVKGQSIVNQYQSVPLLAVANQGQFEISLNVKSDDMAGIGLGSQVDVTVAKTKTKGRVVSLDTAAGDKRVKLKISVSMANARVGQSVKANW